MLSSGLYRKDCELFKTWERQYTIYLFCFSVSLLELYLVVVAVVIVDVEILLIIPLMGDYMVYVPVEAKPKLIDKASLVDTYFQYLLVMLFITIILTTKRVHCIK